MHGMIWFICFVTPWNVSFSLLLQYLLFFLSLSVTSNSSLCCLTTGLSTSYNHSTDSFSCVGLSFCSSVLLDFTWSRLSSYFGSDNYLILLYDLHPLLFPLVPIVRMLIVRIGQGFSYLPKFLHFSRLFHP